MNNGRRKEHHHSHQGCVDTWGQNGRSEKPKLCRSLDGPPLVNNCLCQSGTTAPSQLHLPPKLRETEVENQKKKKKKRT